MVYYILSSYPKHETQRILVPDLMGYTVPIEQVTFESTHVPTVLNILNRLRVLFVMYNDDGGTKNGTQNKREYRI